MSTRSAAISDAQLLQAWFSPAFPVGGFNYSHGLEALVSSGAVADAGSFQDWLHEVICFGAGRNDAILVQACMREPENWQQINDLALASCAGSGRLLETQAQGQAFARTLALAYDVGFQDMDLALPVAAGLAAKAKGLAVKATLRAYLQGMASNLIHAGVRLVPLGQTQAQQALAQETLETRIFRS